MQLLISDTILVWTDGDRHSTGQYGQQLVSQGLLNETRVVFNMVECEHGTVFTCMYVKQLKRSDTRMDIGDQGLSVDYFDKTGLCV